jgi:hypothetical protein
VTVTAVDDTAAEIGTDPALFEFTRLGGDLSVSLTVYYTVSGTAVSGQDYTGLVPHDVVGMVQFAAHQSTTTVIVTPVDDLLIEGDETIIVSLYHSEITAPWVAGLGGGVGWQAAVVLLNGAPGGGGGGGAAGTGLTGQYFNQPAGATPNMAQPGWIPDLSQPALRRVDPKVDFSWATAAPGAGVNPDKFVVQWSGQVKPEFTEEYTFYTLADDGVRLWVNGKLLVDDWKDHAPTESSGKINLQAGQKYDIVMEYFENQLGATAKLSWSSASRAKEIIPMERLYPDQAAQNGNGNGLYGTYFLGDSFTRSPETVKREDAKVDFTWAANNRPATATATQDFSVRWNGQVQPRYSGTYTFYVEAQDGFRLWVDNQQIISSFIQGNKRELSGHIFLGAGRKYNVRLEHFDFRGTAEIKLSWSSASQAKEVIPQSQLYFTRVQQSANAQDLDTPAQWLRYSGDDNVQHQSNAFTFGNGLGQVTVRKDVTATSSLGREVKDMIQLTFTSNLDAVDDVHWLQFITRYWKDKDGNLAPYVSATEKWQQGILRNETGMEKWHLDTESLTEAFYDVGGGSFSRSERSISIFDAPEVKWVDSTDKEAWSLFDTYLVVNGKPVYHVTWERFGRRVSGKWTMSYQNINGAAVTTGLPTWAETDKLLLGYMTFDPNANPPLSDKKEADNPIPASLR